MLINNVSGGGEGLSINGYVKTGTPTDGKIVEGSFVEAFELPADLMGRTADRTTFAAIPYEDNYFVTIMDLDPSPSGGSGGPSGGGSGNKGYLTISLYQIMADTSPKKYFHRNFKSLILMLVLM